MISLNLKILLIKETLKKGNEFVLESTYGNSMWPLISRNDKIYIVYKDYRDLKKGDIILFNKGDSFFLHRIIFFKDGVIYTRGDNNYKNNFEKLSENYYIGFLNKVKKKRLGVLINNNYFFVFKLFSYFKPNFWQDKGE